MHRLPGVLRAGPGRLTIDTDTEPSRHGPPWSCQGGGCSGHELQAALLGPSGSGRSLRPAHRRADTACAHTAGVGGNTHIQASTRAGTHPEKKIRDREKNSKGPSEKEGARQGGAKRQSSMERVRKRPTENLCGRAPPGVVRRRCPGQDAHKRVTEGERQK